VQSSTYIVVEHVDRDRLPSLHGQRVVERNEAPDVEGSIGELQMLDADHGVGAVAACYGIVYRE